ncbi:hypothetical protein ACEWY4_002357 [Coilia grayii]|uniref:Proline-rich protein 15-like n=1 Tax=Coilia grayii TaxID=363190 RepID=A0ABD1KNM8_9TELE
MQSGQPFFLHSPYLDQDQDLHSLYLDQDQDLHTPYLDQNQDLHSPYLDQDQDLHSPYLDQDLHSPYLDQDQDLHSPYLDQDQDLHTLYLDQDQDLHSLYLDLNQDLVYLQFIILVLLRVSTEAEMTEPAPSWWKLTFLRKKKSEPKVLYEIPAEYGSNTGPGPGPEDATADDSQFNARLEKIVDKTATKGRHVKVSHSGRFKEKKRIRSTLAENPELFPSTQPSDENQQRSQ